MGRQPWALFIVSVPADDCAVMLSPGLSQTQRWCAQKLFNDGYSATDIITTLFRIVRNADLQEWIKLEYIKVRHRITMPELLICRCSGGNRRPVMQRQIARSAVAVSCPGRPHTNITSGHLNDFTVPLQEIGFCHIRISDGVNSRLQLSGLLAKLCKLTLQARR